LVAEYSTIIEPTATAKTSYLTNDHLGSPRINTDANGAVTARHDYYPFGEEIGTLPALPGSPQPRTAALGYQSDSVRQKFTGYERDEEADVDFAQARYYNSKHGRFTTTDPILMTEERKFNPQEINLYAYVRNNPLDFVDTFGEKVDFAGKKDSDKYKRNKQYYEDYKKYVNSLKDNDPNKVKLQATIKRLEESGVTYVINVSTDIKGRGAEVEGNVQPDEQGEKIMVNIRNLGNKSEVWSLNSRFAHELEHARQFDAGEIGFERRGDSGWSVMAFDHFDEVNAYRASVAIAVTNGADNTNPKLRGIITGFQDAKGDSAKELIAYTRYRGLGEKEVIRQSNIRNINFENVLDGLQKPKFKGGMQIYCNRGCGKKN